MTSDPDVTAEMRRLNARLPEGSAIIFTCTKSDFAPGGLGTQIMAALSRQIEGTWSLKPGEAGGTCFTLTWPAAEVQTRLPVLAGWGLPTPFSRPAASSTVILR